MKPRRCPICDKFTFNQTFLHRYWGAECLVCNGCGHGFMLDNRNGQDEKEHFSNQSRADYYLEVLLNYSFSSVLDIGTTSDFYFLRKIHQQQPGIKTLGYDVHSHQTPEFVTMVDRLGEDSVELVTCLHVLEHIPDVSAVLQRILASCRYFVFEVPNCTLLTHKEHSSREPHYHFFSEKSFRLLFTNAGASVSFSLRPRDKVFNSPIKRPHFVAYHLPSPLTL